MIPKIHWRFLILSLALFTSATVPVRAANGPISVSYVITNNSDVTAVVWYGVTEGTVNNQWAQPTLTTGSSSSGTFSLPRASLYEGFSQAQMVTEQLAYPQCYFDLSVPNSKSLKAISSQVIVSGDKISGYSCAVKLYQTR